MKYLELLFALDVLSRYYPRYYSHEVVQLAEDVFRWINNELPEGSSTLIYLRSCFNSPADAVKAVWKEINLLAGPFLHPN